LDFENQTMREDVADEELPWKNIVEKSVHDMRTPLSCLRTTVEILRMTSGNDERQLKLVGMLDVQIDELTSHMERLLHHPGQIVQGATGSRL
jgi:signal transduction histidine kinase